MRRFIVTASIAAAALIPSAASAETRSHVVCEQKSSTRTVGTAQEKVIGAIVDAISGNPVAKSARDCDDAFGYYDTANLWHASGIGPAEARATTTATALDRRRAQRPLRRRQPLDRQSRLEPGRRVLQR
jgi:hypothetical protein